MRSQTILAQLLALIAATLALGAGGLACAQGVPVYVRPGAPPPFEPPGYVGAEALPDDRLLPREVIGILRSTGFLPLSPPLRRGRFYLVAVIDPNGEDGQVTIDAISGRFVRFVPADIVGRSMASYPAPSAPPRRSGPRPPMPLSGVASRAPMPAARPPAAPLANPQTANAGTASPGANSAEPVEIKQSFGKPAGGPALQPLQPAPPAQGFD